MRKKLLKLLATISVASMVMTPMEIPGTPISTVIEAEAAYALPDFPKAKAGTYKTKKSGNTVARIYYTNAGKRQPYIVWSERSIPRQEGESYLMLQSIRSNRESRVLLT